MSDRMSKEVFAKLTKIKICLFDVDGILTDAKVWFDGEVGFNRTFNVRDGYGLKLLIEHGIVVGIISGGNSTGVIERFKQLGIKDTYLGNEDKRSAYLDMRSKYNVTDEQMLYMGDELFDLPLLKKCGFSATVPSACSEVLQVVDYITSRDCGNGAVREVVDHLREAQNIRPHIPDFD
jgi:3-deoxy-D-manno-octulosonate 8-phosphate phosphatase (KDO 8-P phosphatase)